MNKYHLIFGGRGCIDARIDLTNQEEIDELREEEDRDELLYRVQDISIGDEAHIYGVSNYSGYIKVYELFEGQTHINEEQEPIITINTDEFPRVETTNINPSADQFIIGYIINQDGKIGHLELETESAFDISNLTLKYTSGSAIGCDSAITGIKYKSNDTEIDFDNIDPDNYLEAYPKVELCFISRFDKDLNEEVIYDYNGWFDEDEDD